MIVDAVMLLNRGSARIWDWVTASRHTMMSGFHFAMSSRVTVANAGAVFTPTCWILG